MAGDITLSILLLTAAASAFSAIALWSPRRRWPAGLGAGIATLLGAAVFFGAIGYAGPLDWGRHLWAAHPAMLGASLPHPAMRASVFAGRRHGNAPGPEQRLVMRHR